MNKHIKQLVLAAALAAVVFGASAGIARADDPAEKPSFNKEAMKERWQAKREAMHKELGITSEQAGQLEAQKKEHRESMKGLFDEIKAKRQALGAELQKQELDLPAVQKVHNELKALNARKEDSRLEGILAARKILTPEQFSKMTKFMEERGKKGRNFKGEHGGGWRNHSGTPGETDAE